MLCCVLIFALAHTVEHFFEAVKFKLYLLEKEIWFKPQPEQNSGYAGV